jgi:hypothetical protein
LHVDGIDEFPKDAHDPDDLEQARLMVKGRGSKGWIGVRLG